MPVDPWAGTNQGLASLNETFDTLSNRRRQEEQDARQARIDALQEPILRAQGEDAALSLDEKRRKITDLRAYDAARKDLEANPGTVPTVTEYTPPGSMTGLGAIKERNRLPADIPVQGATEMTYAGEGGPVSIPKESLGALPTQGLPTQEIAGERPLNPSEMASRRMMLAVQHGQYDEVAKIGTIMDITDKIQGNEAAQLAKMMANAKANRQIMGPEAALAQLKREALAARLPKELVDKFTMNRDGIISYPDGQGGIIAIVEKPDGTSSVQHIAAKEPKSATETDLYLRAAKGDPEAAKAVAAIQAGKIRVAKEGRADQGMGAAGALNIPPGVPGERNDAALQGMSQANMQIVKQLVDYKIPLPSGFALKAPFWQEILGRAALYDPSFDATQYQVRMSVKRGFNSGKEATNIRGLNTAISHLETMADKAKALNNSSLPIWNSIINSGISAVGDPRVVGLNTTATAVESELASVFKGMGATDQEIKAWRANFNSSQSPAQIKESIGTAIELLGGRLQALNSQYETGMGRPKDFHFLSDKSRAILKKLGANVDAIDGVSGKGYGPGVQDLVQRNAPSTPSGAVPVPGKVTKDGKAVYQLPNGKYWAQD